MNRLTSAALVLGATLIIALTGSASATDLHQGAPIEAIQSPSTSPSVTPTPTASPRTSRSSSPSMDAATQTSETPDGKAGALFMILFAALMGGTAWSLRHKPERRR